MNVVSQITEEQYRALNSVSYSSLSAFANHPQLIKSDEEKELDAPYLLLGSVVDIMLTGTPKEFDQKVYVMTAEKPNSEMMLTFCRVFAETGDQKKAHEASGYKIGLDQLMKKFDKEGRSFYDSLIKAGDRMIIDADLLFTANQIVQQLTTNPFTMKYFESDNLFQVPIQWKIHYQSLLDGQPKVMDAKSLLDIVRVDHERKEIQPIDLKVGGEGFMRSYWRYRRYLQASMYTDALMFATWDKSEIAQEYNILPMKFIYADSNLKREPVIYNSTNVDIKAGREGVSYLVPIAGLAKSFEDDEIHKIDSIAFGPSNIDKVKGYAQLAAELEWHIANDKWDYSYDVYKNNGEIDINAFDVKL